MEDLLIKTQPETRDLSDQEKIELFSDIKLMPGYVGVCPPVVSEVTQGGIVKTQQTIAQEEASAASQDITGNLVVNLGSLPQVFRDLDVNLETGDYAIIRLVMLNNPQQSVEREGQVMLVYELNHLTGFKKAS
jgi:hypothetical protein